MKEEKSSLILRKWTKQLFLALFIRSRLTPNQITTANFLLTSVPSVYFLWTGHNLLCLLFIFINIPVDFLDGEIAKATHQFTRVGEWLDTSLDWLWQLMILATLTYISGYTIIGLIAIIAVVYSNYISATSKKQLDDFPFVMKYYLFFGILTTLYGLTLSVIALAYISKTLITGFYALKERTL